MAPGPRRPQQLRLRLRLVADAVPIEQPDTRLAGEGDALSVRRNVRVERKNAAAPGCRNPMVADPVR